MVMFIKPDTLIPSTSTPAGGFALSYCACSSE